MVEKVRRVITSAVSRCRAHQLMAGVMLAFVFGGLVLTLVSRAATPSIAQEPESGNLSGEAKLQAGSGASGGSMIRFGQSTVFTQTSIPLTDPELANPNRGLYVWNSDAGAPQTDQPMDVYVRVLWSKIETSEGNYDFSQLDAALAEAKKRGGKMSFRVMAENPSGPVDPATGIRYGIPDYIVQAMPKGWVHTSSSGNKTYIPDWNNETFLTRADALFAALAARYDSNPAVDRLDIGLYGLTGEWHMGIEGDDYNDPKDWPMPSGAEYITQASMKRLINAQVSHFIDKQWVMLWGNAGIAYGVNYAMSYPGISKPIGVRNDCMG